MKMLQGGLGLDPTLQHPVRHLSAIEVAAKAGQRETTEALFNYSYKDRDVPVNHLLKLMVRAIENDWVVLVEVVLDAGMLPVDAVVKPANRQTMLMFAAKKGKVSEW